MNPAVLNFRREELEARIEEMVALLDLIDGDADLEDDDLEIENEHGDGLPDDEPWLGWTNAVNQTDAYRMGSTFEPDREENGDEIDTNFAEDDYSSRGW